MTPKSELERQLEESIKLARAGKLPRRSLSDRLKHLEGDDLPDSLEGPGPDEDDEE